MTKSEKRALTGVIVSTFTLVALSYLPEPRPGFIGFLVTANVVLGIISVIALTYLVSID